MNRGMTLASCLGLGAGLMYILDPDRGSRRRAMLRDQMVRAARKTGDALDATARDLSHRARGLSAEAGHLFRKEEVSDEVLVERVRAKLGRVVSHPHSVTVTADQGRVTLGGPILESEAGDLLGCVSKVRGVTDVVNQLEPHKQAGDVPGLQGGTRRPGERSEFMQTNWSPAARLLAGAAGGVVALYGLNRGGITGAAVGALGAGLLARGLTNVEMKRLTGLGGGRRAIDVHKTINIVAPVEEVFKFWTDFENFPRFMRNVREVTDKGNGRSHWKVAGPAGVPVEWDAVVTKLVPNEVLAWKSVPGSAVDNAGIITFRSNDDGTTQAGIKLSYNPPAGALGHAVAALFGADPKTEMDEDLMRMKTFLETGVRPRDAAESKPSAREATTRSR